MKSYLSTLKTYFIIIPLFASQLINANNNDSIAFKINFKGFIKSDVIFDSRQTVSAREGFVLLYPQKPMLDANGKDINQGFHLNQYASSSRLIAQADHQLNSNTKLKMYLETDFTGSSNATYNSMRLRHAFIRIEKEKMFFMMGHDWHPLVAEDVFPDMVSLNLGNPFKSAIRVPQLRLGFKNYHKIDFFITASTQLDNSSNGPDGISTKYLRDAAIPNLSTNIQWISGDFKIGGLIDYKVLKFSNNDSILGIQKDYCHSMTYSIYGKYENPKFLAKSQLILGENLFEHVMLGGVAQKSGSYDFLASQTASAWINIFWKTKKINLGFFAGYTENMGYKNETDGNYFTRGSDIHSIYRFAPQLLFKASNKLLLFSETELTTALFGTTNTFGKVEKTKSITNIRENISIILLF
jgi:hypothetical protein